MGESVRLAAQKKWLTRSYPEIIELIDHPKPEKTAEQIISDTIKGAGLKL